MLRPVQIKAKSCKDLLRSCESSNEAGERSASTLLRSSSVLPDRATFARCCELLLYNFESSPSDRCLSPFNSSYLPHSGYEEAQCRSVASPAAAARSLARHAARSAASRRRVRTVGPRDARSSQRDRLLRRAIRQELSRAAAARSQPPERSSAAGRPSLGPPIDVPRSPQLPDATAARWCLRARFATATSGRRRSDTRVTGQSRVFATIEP